MDARIKSGHDVLRSGERRVASPATRPARAVFAGTGEAGSVL